MSDAAQPTAAEVRAAAEAVKTALDRHLAAVERRSGEDDPAVYEAFNELATAAEEYDELLYDRYDERSERAGRGTVRAKTGTLRDVSALAGFLVTADGSPLVFAILANHVARPFAVQDWVDRTTAGWASCGCR